MNNLFTFFTSKNAPFHFPGVSFELGALFMLLSLLIAWNMFRKERKARAAKAG
jgi:DHA1 family tetracycline resistance protein-like MFS transporter